MADLFRAVPTDGSKLREYMGREALPHDMHLLKPGYLFVPEPGCLGDV